MRALAKFNRSFYIAATFSLLGITPAIVQADGASQQQNLVSQSASLRQVLSRSRVNIPIVPNNRFVLNILHINDNHSHLEPDSGALNFDGVSTDVEMGGFTRIVSAMHFDESRLSNVLKLHAGDAITGTIYYTLFKGEPDARLMNMVCFDAFALGNHEFDDSDSGLAQFLSMLRSDPDSCQTPVLAANVIPTFGTPLYPWLGASMIEPFTIKEVGGEYIGIIGIDIAGKTRNSSSPLPSTQFLDETMTAQFYIDKLSAMGVNKIVLLTHYTYQNDLHLAQNLHGVDIIVGGDSHSLLGERFADFGLSPEGPYPSVVTNLDGDPVCVVQAWQYSNVLGHLQTNFDNQGRVLECAGAPRLLLGDQFEQNGTELAGDERQRILDIIAATPELLLIEPDPAAEELLASYSAEVDILKQSVVGIANQNICLARVPGDSRSALCPAEATRANGGDIQQLVTQAFLARSLEADVALQNAGGVRIDIPAGEITIDTVFTLLPFANTLVNLDMQGWEIKQVLEEAVSNFVDNNGSNGSYPYAANLRWNLDLSQPAGQRFSNIEIRRKGSDTWAPLGNEDQVKVVTNSFIAAGRDGYFTFGDVSNDGRVVDTFIDYAQAFTDYLQQDIGGAIPGESILLDPPRFGALPCTDYSTQVFINEQGLRQDPDPLAGRACKPK